MSELDLESLVNQINGCGENEKRIILSQLAKNEIYLLIEAITNEIDTLKKLEQDMKKLFADRR